MPAAVLLALRLALRLAPRVAFRLAALIAWLTVVVRTTAATLDRLRLAECVRLVVRLRRRVRGGRPDDVAAVLVHAAAVPEGVVAAAHDDRDGVRRLGYAVCSVIGLRGGLTDVPVLSR